MSRPRRPSPLARARRAPSWRALRKNLLAWPVVWRTIWETRLAEWARPEMRAALAGLRADLGRKIERLQGEAQSQDYSRLSARDLVTWLEGALWVDHMARTLVPRDIVRRFPDSEIPLVMETLLRASLLLCSDGEQIDPQGLALRAAAAYLRGARVWAEIQRRGANYKPGFHAALFAWFVRAEQEARAGEHLERVGEISLEYLTRRARRRVTREGDDVPSQIFLTIQNRLGKQDPLSALVDALDGRYDVIPRAVRDDLAGAGRPAKRKGQHEVEIVFLEEEEEYLESPEAPPDMNAAGREELAALRALAGEDYQVARLVISAMEGDETQAQIAERWGVTTRQVRYMIAHLKERFLE
jgi:hypothetical protein